jgi:hypothetical protein
MKLSAHLTFGNAVIFLILIFAFATGSLAQPQYYNYNTPGTSNSFPFNIAAGKQVQLLYLAGDFNQPTPAPAGNITSLSFMMFANLGPFTYSNFVIKMGQAAITAFAAGVWYTGQLDTVYSRASVSFSGTVGQWMTITFDRPFLYNPAQSLVVDIQQCGAPGATGFSLSHSTLTGFRRNTSLTTSACPFVWGQQSGTTAHVGVNIVPAGTVANPDTVCYAGPIPAYPSGMFGHASENLGDTLYIVGGSATGVPSTAVYAYSMTTKTWSTGVPLPTAKAGGDLVRCGSSLYYIGGGLTAITAGDAAQYKYTPGAGWTAIANIPTPVTGNVAECWGDSVIFCMAGGWSTYLTTVQVYRPASNTWSTSTPIPIGRRSFAGGLWGNKLFVAAGFSGTYRNDFYIGTIGADANTITWAPGPTVPLRGTGSSRPGGHAVNGRFYFLTGETTPAPALQDSIYIWDIAGSTWLPQIIRGRGAGTASNYWGVVSSTIRGNNLTIWVPGGGLTGATQWGLYALVDDCRTVDVEPVAEGIPTEYQLSQNYPNPFNPTTTIQYGLPVAANVTLKIYSVLGQEVATLVDGLRNAGTFQTMWDGRSSSGAQVASGMYFYSLVAKSADNASTFMNIKKMLLLK